MTRFVPDSGFFFRPDALSPESLCQTLLGSLLCTQGPGEASTSV